jgi:hypothetical protein
MGDEFGDAYGRVLPPQNGQTAKRGPTAHPALAAGVPARDVWLALCDAQDVPESRRYGVGQREPKK